MEAPNVPNQVATDQQNSTLTTVIQPKTVTFRYNYVQKNNEFILKDKIESQRAKNEEAYNTVKMQRNKIRSVQRANEQKAFSRLKDVVPTLSVQPRRASKLDTLKHACAYIRFLKEVVEKLEEVKATKEKEKTEKEGSAESKEEALRCD
eukprot:Seg955.7 transcript_id=Seg955.7/GoldUCD/mRNA.D3Y31 product="hypothetical protein" protein_id=Seg955.7/GoldUCD/D3Y31